MTVSYFEKQPKKTGIPSASILPRMLSSFSHMVLKPAQECSVTLGQDALHFVAL